MTFADLNTGDEVFLLKDSEMRFEHRPRGRYTTQGVPLTFFQGSEAITLTVEAVYENGVLKPTKPLPLREQERVQITIAPRTNWVQETYGICGWKGSAEEAERFATDPELDFPLLLPRQ